MKDGFGKMNFLMLVQISEPRLERKRFGMVDASRGSQTMGHYVCRKTYHKLCHVPNLLFITPMFIHYFSSPFFWLAFVGAY